MINKELLNEGVKLLTEKKFNEADKIFDELIESNSENLAILGVLSNFFIKANQPKNAKKCLRKICHIKEDFNTIKTLASLEYETMDFDLAAALLTKVVENQPDEKSYEMLVNSFYRLGLFSNALKHAEDMLEHFPENISAVLNVINNLVHIGKAQEAEQLCFEYLKKYPKSPNLWVQLGLLQEHIYGNNKQALECFLNAYKLDDNLETSTTLYHIAVGYDRLNDFDNALIFYKKYLEAHPNDPSGSSSLGMTYLRKKMFKEGFEEFFKRDVSKFSIEGNSNNLYKLGDKFEENILIVCDQGLGDHLQFIRYLPLIKDKFKTIQVACLEPLVELFRENYPDIEFLHYVDMDKEKQAIRICDIPYLFNIDFDNIPFSNGYLDTTPTNIKSDKFKVGLCWEAGGTGIRGPLDRTVNPKYLEPIFELENIDFYLLQLGDTFDFLKTHPQIINLGKDFKNFKDTAQAVKVMDAVICVDTSVLHLVGAMGVKAFLLLPYISDWRWFDDTKTTPWYDSVEIFKQTEPINWEEQIKEIICRLKELSS